MSRAKQSRGGKESRDQSGGVSAASGKKEKEAQANLPVSNLPVGRRRKRPTRPTFLSLTFNRQQDFRLELSRTGVYNDCVKRGMVSVPLTKKARPTF